MIFLLLMTSLLGFFDPIGPATASSGGDLSTAEITGLSITGDAGAVRITTDADRPYVASLAGRRSGWFSGWYSNWFFNACETGSRMHVTNGVLQIEVRSNSWMDISDCTVEIVANIPSGNAVAIALSAVQARFAGDFKSLAVSARAGDVSLVGHAEAITLKSQAMRASLDFDKVTKREDVAIDVQNLDATINLRPETPISYSVKTVMSYVDSSLPNTDGARPHFAFNAERAHIRIR